MRGQVLTVLFSSYWTKLWPNDLYKKCIQFKSYCKCLLIKICCLIVVVFGCYFLELCNIYLDSSYILNGCHSNGKTPFWSVFFLLFKLPLSVIIDTNKMTFSDKVRNRILGFTLTPTHKI